MNCDRPSLLSSFPGEVTDGRCVPWSRALILQDDAVAQVQATCRKKLIRPQESPLFDEIDIIAHSVTEGTTCWFQALSANPTGDPAIGLDGSKVPSPTMDKNPEGFPDPLAFWQTPQQIAKIDCGNCHDNDPFYYSPWIAQTGELPADPFGRYNNNVGPMSLWTRPMSIETPGNTCTGCHRIGNLHTCHTGMYQTFDPKTIEFLSAWGKQYPQSHWMPAGNKWTKAQWDVVYTDAIEALATCCKDPKAAECTLTEVASVVN